jgi:hypothetical protein
VIHRQEQPGQSFEDRHLGAGARIDLAEFECHDGVIVIVKARGGLLNIASSGVV